MVTLNASKSIPAFIKAYILQYIEADKGVHFATETLAKYSILLIGFIVAFQFIGITWSKVQWLAAAFTVGLGFGLQEIFANFISGLIILFERPVRVGDVITIGNTTGVVSQIRMRATTITDWDRKELLVPNKEFITGQLVNWTLSDTILRLIVPVGIAYGSDTDKAYKALTKIAENNTNVLKDPKPVVLFKTFADSALSFELRVYIASVDFYIETLHQLHMVINREFREIGIEIAFPQRDIHIKSICKEFPQINKNIE